MQEKQSQFLRRHVGPRQHEIQNMLEVIGVQSIQELIEQTIPQNIISKKQIRIPEAKPEHELLSELKEISRKNIVLKSCLGQGYYNCIVPSVIKRNILENPGWYTQYTPYQSEISQGRLEALLIYQTMIEDMTGLPVANASLLDEGTAAAEAMIMAYNIVNKTTHTNAKKFFISSKCFRQTIDVVIGRAVPQNIEVVVGNHETVKLDKDYFGALVQYPAEDGSITDFTDFVNKVHNVGGIAIAATDLLALALFTSPGELNFDIAIGNSQRFGVPLGYGGPHAGFFATKNEYIRYAPGRIIGVSIDAQNKPAYRMTLQTREQHIRREKATSNICTAQALLAIMAGMYAVYHGPEGIRNIALRVHNFTKLLDNQLRKLGYNQLNKMYFDTLCIETKSKKEAEKILKAAKQNGYNLRLKPDKYIGISLDETITHEDIEKILQSFASVKKKKGKLPSIRQDVLTVDMPLQFLRRTSYLQHPTFALYHSETAMMRYLKSLENKDLSLTGSMIPLGSCTMKLNPATALYPISWREFADMHPFVPIEQAEGYQEIFKDLEKALCNITGFTAASLQPNSGAQGEFTGLLVIKAYHSDHKQSQRDVILIPSSAHGTNPASASMAGMKIITVECDNDGNIDVDDLKKKAEQNKNELAGLMVTYPSTHGVFEERIKEICEIIHNHGGLVYMDGANLNAMVGLTSPAEIGADVCHINLHKTFGIPHGGGGPGAGPICVSKKLAPYLPGHSVVKIGNKKSINAVSSAPWGSANILLISYAYIRLLGAVGLTEATKTAILNANYLKTKLEKEYKILYKNTKHRIAHEFILDVRQFKDEAGIEAEDIAKRLIDYSFHSPTVSFPVHGTLMIEPTESEPKAELDRFVEAMLSIRKEIQSIVEGKLDRSDNPIKNAPHTIEMLVDNDWKHNYPREQAVFPVPTLRKNKFWPSVARVNNTYGDRNIVVRLPELTEFNSSHE